MSETNKPGIAFWIIGIIALLWNGMGVNNYLQQAFKTESTTAELNAEQLAFMDGLPAWMTALFAIAVFTGLIACILLLMRKKMAIVVFIVSFISASILQLYWMFGTKATEIFNESMPYLIPILVIVIAAFLVLYSRDQKAKGVLS